MANTTALTIKKIEGLSIPLEAITITPGSFPGLLHIRIAPEVIIPPGDTYVKISAIDPEGNENIINFELHNSTGKAPIVQGDIKLQIKLGEIINVPVSASDPQNLPLKYSIDPTNKPAWIEIAPDSNIINGQAIEAGTSYCIIIVDNGVEKTKVQLTIEVEDADLRPIIKKIPSAETTKVIVDNPNFSFQIEADNPFPNTDLEYLILADEDSDWLKIDTESGVLTGIPKTIGRVIATAIISNSPNSKRMVDFDLEVIAAPEGDQTDPALAPEILHVPEEDIELGSNWGEQILINNPDEETACTFEFTDFNDESWIKYDNRIGFIYGTPLNTGTLSGKVTVSNKHGAVSQNFSVKIISKKSLLPEITRYPDESITIYARESFVFQINATNPLIGEKEKLKYTLDKDESSRWLFINQDTGRMDGIPPKPGKIWAVIYVINSKGQSKQEISLLIQEARSADVKFKPILNPVTIYAEAGKYFKTQINVRNPEAITSQKNLTPPLIYISIKDAPNDINWLSVYPSIHLITGQYKDPVAKGKRKEFVFTLVADNGSARATTSLTIWVISRLTNIKKPKDQSKEHDVLKRRELAIIKAIATGNPFILAGMPKIITPSYIEESKQWAKGKIREKKAALGYWALDKFDQHIFNPVNEWTTFHIKQPIQKKIQKIKLNIGKGIVNLARDRKSGFRPIFVFARNVKRKKKKAGFVKALISEILKRSVEGLLKFAVKAIRFASKVAKSIPGVKQLSNAIGNSSTSQWMKLKFEKFATSPLGQKILTKLNINSHIQGLISKLDDVDFISRIGDKIVRIKNGLVSVVTFTGNVLKTVGLGFNLAGNLISNKALLTGGLLGAAAFAVTQSPVVAVLFTGAGVGVGAYHNFLSQMPRELSLGNSFYDKLNNNVGNFQRANGWGQYNMKNINPGNIEEIANSLKGKTSIFTRNQTLFRSTNAGLLTGSIGAIIGSFFGGPAGAMIGGAVGFAGGFAGQMIYDRYFGKIIASALEKQGGFLAKLACIPSTVILGKILGNVWLVDQLRLIDKVYHGDFARYLKDNWSSANIFALAMNSLGAWGYLQSSMQIGKYFVTVAAEKLLGAAVGGGLLGAAFTFATMAGSLIGMVAGYFIGSWLGFGTGIAAITGAAIGGAAGAIVGTAITAGVIGLSSGILAPFVIPIGLAITAVTSAIGSVIGQFIGWKWFDKTLGTAMNGIMTTINIFQAILSISQIMMSRANSDSIVVLMFSTISLVTILDQTANQSGSSNCIEQGSCGDPAASATFDSNNQINLGYYNIKLLNSPTASWDYPSIQKILIILKELDSSNNFNQENRPIYLTQGNDAIFTDPSFILISIDLNQLNANVTLEERLGEAIQIKSDTQEGDNPLQKTAQTLL
ncbi:MAG: hypothetical protein WCJ58_02205 [bacterium]